MLCPSNKCAIFGCLVFATIFILSGTVMAATGILTVIKMPVLFKVGSLIWTGILVFCMGVAKYFLLLCCGPPEFRKNVALFVLCVIVFLFCLSNLILLELVEWKESYETTMEPIMKQSIANFLNVEYARDVSRVSTIVGLVSSLLSLVYVYIIMVHPTKKEFMLQKARKSGKYPLNYMHAPRIVVPPPDSPARGKFKYRCPTELAEPRSSWVYEGTSIAATNSLKNRGGVSPDDQVFPVIIIENQIRILNQADVATSDANQNLKVGKTFQYKGQKTSTPREKQFPVIMNQPTPLSLMSTRL